MHSGEVAAALRQYRHPLTYRKEWLFFTEVRTGTGYTRHGRRGGENYIDALALNCWPSNNYLRVAYEIKVSRSDFIREIKQPDKRKLAMHYAQEFYFAAPVGLLRADEMPDECGLIEVTATGVHVARRAGRRVVGPPDWGFVASILRQAQDKMTVQSKAAG